MMYVLAVLISVALMFPAMSEAAGDVDWNKMSTAELQQQAPQLHPAALYTLAAKLFRNGNKDEAVFWFYVGQLRYRSHLKSSPKLDPSGDPALFASLSEVVGRPINEYAFGDILLLARTIDRILDWDEKNANATTSKKTHAKEWREIREGLRSMQKEIQASKEQIKKQREKNGLPNRR